MPVLERKWWTLIAVCTAVFMLLLDITVVNVALPDIQRELHSSFSDLQWVVDAYSLTLAAFLLTAGVAGDIYGRRIIFAVGLIVFSAASFAVRAVDHAVDAQPGARRAGRRRRHHVRHLAGADRRRVHRPGPRHRLRPLRRRHRRRRGHRPAGGRRHHQRVGMAVDLLRQRPHRCRRRLPHLRQGGRVAATRGSAASTGSGFITFSASLFALVFALVRGNDLGWSSTTIVGLLVASARADAGVLRQRGTHEGPHARPGAVPHPGLRGDFGRRLHAGGVHFRHVPVPDAVHPGRPGLRAAGRRGTLPAADADGLRRRLLRRPADRVRALALPARDRHAPDHRRAPLHGDDQPELHLDRPACPASSCAVPASARSTRSSPPPQSRSCNRSAAAWPRAPTTRSARSGSPPASPSSAPSSRAKS